MMMKLLKQESEIKQDMHYTTCSDLNQVFSQAVSIRGYRTFLITMPSFVITFSLLTIISILLLLIITSPDVFAITINESEMQDPPVDNNDFANATSIINNTTVIGSVDKSRDPSDYYIISIPAGKGLWATLTFEDPDINDLDIYLYNSSRMFVSWADSTYSPEELYWISTNTSSYYLEIWAYMGASNYTLTVLLLDAAPDYNDDPSAAVRLYNNSVMNGSVHYIFDPDDWYYVELNWTPDGAQKVMVNLLVENEDADLDLYILDLDSYWDYGFDDFTIASILNMSWFGSPNETASFISIHPGSYYIWVNAYKGESNYSLSITIINCTADNDSNIDNAVSVGPSDVTITGDVDQADDHYDWYAFNLSAGSGWAEGITLSANFTHTPGAVVFLAAFDYEEWEVMEYAITETEYTTSTTLFLNFTSRYRGAGWYYVAVGALYSINSTGFKVDENAAAHYTIIITRINISFDNNDNFAEATSVNIGDTATGSLHKTFDKVDFFKFTAQEGDLISVRVNEMQECDFDIYLYNSSAQNIYSYFGYSFFDESLTPETPFEEFNFTAPANDTYYVRIVAYKGSGDYTIIISRITPLPSIISFYPRENPVEVASGSMREFSIIASPAIAGDILTYRWYLNSVPLENMTTQINFTTEDKTPGQYTLTVSVCERERYSVNQTWTVVVLDINDPPVINSSSHPPVSFSSADTLVIHVEAYDPDSVLTYYWYVNTVLLPSFSSSNTLYLTRADLESLSINITSGLNISLSITDGEQWANTSWLIVLIEPPQKNISLLEEEIIDFSLYSPYNESAISWFISKEGQPFINISQNTSMNRTHYKFITNITSSGNYALKVEVASNYYLWNITVLNKNMPPVANIDSPLNGSTYLEDELIVF
ncbi:MAG: pre-peptidase C-terminal domain-containing protein, partial [Thermoplasmata archaeon]